MVPATLARPESRHTAVCRRVTNSPPFRFQGLVTLIAFSSSQILRAIFQTRAFLGFSLQSFPLRKDPYLFQGRCSLAFHSKLTTFRLPVLSSASELHSLCGATLAAITVRQLRELLLSWGFAFLRPSPFQPWQPFRATNYFALSYKSIRIRTGAL